MLRYASKLSDDYEYGLLWLGQSNADANGSKNDGFVQDPHLNQKAQGKDLTAAIDYGTGTETIAVLEALVAGAWIGAEFRAGRPDTPLVGYGTVISNTAVDITVSWTKAAATGSPVLCFLNYRDGRYNKYDKVRVLTTYLPDQMGAYPAGTPLAPGFTLPATITSHEDAGVFLPFTLMEGISGHGETEADALAASAGSGALTRASGAMTVDLFAGAHLIVWHDGGASWMDVTGNDATILTGAAWLGAGTPTGTASGWTYIVWIPHYYDNPHAYPLGPGYLYPSNISQPKAAVRNRPVGNTNWGWGTDKFGAMLSYASRVSDSIGRRVNVIPLAIDASSLVSTYNVAGGALNGWFSPTTRIDWQPQTPGGLAERLSKLIRTVAPAALTAEGNTKPLRILAMSGFFCESESTREDGRQQAKNVIPQFWNWVRNEIHEAGLSPYSSKDHIPVVQASLPTSPWELAATIPGFGSGDVDGLVNAAISDYAAKAPFVATFDTNDSPQIVGNEIHFNGYGEAINGRLDAEQTIALIDAAMSVEGNPNDPIAVNICNMALSYIGDVAKITSLDTTVDLSAQATYCARFYQQARDILLQQMAWSFATKRAPLEVVTDARDEEWAFAYGYPDGAARVFAVLPPDAGDDYISGVRGTANVQDATGAIRTLSFANEVPLPFTIEQDDDGHRIIYTNTENAVGRYNALVSDASDYPPLFRNCLALKLASMLAGPVMRGTEGAKLTGALLQMLELEMGKAEKQDAVQHNVRLEHTPRSIKARW